MRLTSTSAVKSLLLLVFAVCSCALHGQTTIGIQRLGSYDVSKIDQINLADLDVHIDKPLYVHQGRGPGMGTSIHLVYDSSSAAKIGWNGMEIGWVLSGTTGGSGSILAAPGPTQNCPSPDGNFYGTYVQYSWAFVDATGYTHPFSGWTTQSSCTLVPNPEPTTSLSETASDGSGYLLSAQGYSSTVTSVDGVKYSTNAATNGGTNVTDPNGNQASMNSLAVSNTIYAANLTDDSGVNVVVSGGGIVKDSSGNSVSRNPVLISYTGTSGSRQSITISYRMSSVTPYAGLTPLIDAVSYPDGSAYHFTYANGILESIELPGGGTVTYLYSFCNSTPCTTTLKRTTSDGATTYTNTVPSFIGIYPVTADTVISHPDGSSENIHFVGSTIQAVNQPFAAPINLETAHYWYESNGTPLKSTMKCYNGSSGNCTTTPISIPVTKTNTTTTYPGIPSSTKSELLSAVSGLVTDLFEWDYGVATTSGATRHTATTYAALGNNILNRPSSTTITDSAGGLVAQTKYTYDEYSPLGARGNLTTVQRYVAGTTYLSTHTHYNNAGQPVSSTDANSNITQYSYDPTGTYVTLKTYPPVAAGTFSESYTFDPNTGLPITSKDVNGKSTTFSYDSTLRLIGTCRADGSYTQIIYNSPTETTLNQLQGTGTGCTPGGGVPSGPWATTTVQYDGYGRTSHSTDPAGNTVDTAYDVTGRVITVSNPHSSSPSSTDGKTIYRYDGLGRKTSEENPDKSFKQWCYNGIPPISQSPCSAHLGAFSGTWVDVTDEQSHMWQQTTDGLGRLVDVFEPNGTASNASMETDYYYDVLDDLTLVVQLGNSPGSGSQRTRLFVPDGIGRIVDAYNPETGWVCYGTTGGVAPNGANCTEGYDLNGNLLHKTDARALQLNYSYDTWNRLLTKTGTGFSYSYTWDAASALGSLASNEVGHLGKASNGVNASEQYAYDPMGRVIYEGNCIPSNCSATGNAFAATYDLQGDLNTLAYPDGRSLKMSWDGAGKIQTVAFDHWGSTHVGYNYLSSSQYYPNGSLEQLSFGNGAGEFYSVNSRGQATSAALIGSTANLQSQTLSSREYIYEPPHGACPASGCLSHDNGNIYQVVDDLNSNRTQTFTFDTLNRIASVASSDASMKQNYTIDSFGNMSQAGTFTNIMAFNTNNRISSGQASYDANGNVTAVNNGVATTSYTIDAENRISQVNTGTIASYTYNPQEQRVRKDVPGSWTEYVYFAGKPLAQKHSDGSWSDYIYANDKLISRADSYDRRIHIHGTTNSSGSWAAWSLPLTAFLVKTGDKLSWRQYQAGGAHGGISVGFSDGSSGGWVAKDQSGQYMNADAVNGNWLYRTVDLSSFAGKTLNSMWVDTDTSTPVGATWDNWFGEIAFVRSDGTVFPVFARDSTASLTYHSGGSILNPSGVVESANSATDSATPWETTTYFHSDQVGSTKTMTSSGGWPIWTDTYYPYGVETSSVSAVNPYRFTGEERDIESGNDYFGARYYASSMGRFMSPDPAGLMFADLSNPQSFNLYSYVLNNPLKFTDPTGLYCYYGDTNYSSAQGQADQNDSSQWDFHSNSGECGANGGQWASDAETHTDWHGRSWDNSGRDEYAVSAVSDATPQPPVQYTSMGAQSCPLCFDPNFNYNTPIQQTVSAFHPTAPPPVPSTGDCILAPTEATEIHAMAMQIWRQQNGLPSSMSAANDSDTGGEGVAGTYLTTQSRTFFVGNKGYQLKPGPIATAPNANLQGAAGANAAAMAADYATSATGCLVSK